MNAFGKAGEDVAPKMVFYLGGEDLQYTPPVRTMNISDGEQVVTTAASKHSQKSVKLTGQSAGSAAPRRSNPE